MAARKRIRIGKFPGLYSSLTDDESGKRMEILLAGNTGYLTEEWIEQTFPGAHVLICGDTQFKYHKGKVSILRLQEQRVEEIDLKQYELDRIVYFSHFLTVGKENGGEIEALNHLLEYCIGRRIQFLYIMNENREEHNPILINMAGDICGYYQEKEGISLKIVNAPCLYSAKYCKDWLNHIFQSLEMGKIPEFPKQSEDMAVFLYLDDLGELIFRIFDNWDKDDRVLEIPDVFHIDWGELKTEILKLFPDLKLNNLEKFKKTVNTMPDSSNVDIKEDLTKNTIREKYGWFPKISILEDLNDQYLDFLAGKKKQEDWRRQILNRIAEQTTLIKWIEIILFFGISEIIHRILGNSVQFRYIDVRLLYVVIIGTIYGLNEGVAAAFLAVCALTLSYIREGINGLTLFYEPSNWLPYILYFVVGAVCGYVQIKNRKDIAFANEENALLKEKFLFVRALYQDTTEEKLELKRQLLGRKDSFGKIFNITRKLDSVRPQEIFIQTVRVLEEILENHSIQIYSFGKNPYFARLEAASKEISETTPRSLRVEDYKDAVDAVENDGIWVNRELKSEYPVYMAGIRKDERLVLLICIYHASYEQMNLYYENLVKILCGLVETALLRALAYQAVLYQERHVGGMIFLKEPYFLEKLKLYHSMFEEQIAEYTLLKLDRKQMTAEEASDVLETKIREIDTAGMNEDGEIYLILHQTSPENAGIVIKRLEESGFSCQIVT